MDPTRLVLYDGDCGFCQRSVRWVLDADRAGSFHFAPLQGPTAAELRRRHPDIPTDLDSIIYVDRSGGTERVAWRSEAILRICAELGGWWRAVSWLRWLPRGLRDLGYRAFARNRHRLAGSPRCDLPDAAVRARFLP
jgi:predicted DCC family thiol-disulfide oxidoreductase YuxK